MNASLSELATLCEAATADEQGYFLTYAFELINGRHPPRVHGGSDEMSAYLALRNPFTDKLNAKAYLDAAITLVPEGHSWRCGFGVAGWAAVHKGQIPSYRSDPIAATAALALCAAALRARVQVPA